jgi:hypothetical protein
MNCVLDPRPVTATPLIPSRALLAVAETTQVDTELERVETRHYLWTVSARIAREAGENYRQWLADGAHGMDPLEARDPANECAHGNLPLDRVITCECWGTR